MYNISIALRLPIQFSGKKKKYRVLRVDKYLAKFHETGVNRYQKPAFSSDMSGGAIVRNFSEMAISRDLGRVRRRAPIHFEAEIRGFRLI